MLLVNPRDGDPPEGPGTLEHVVCDMTNEERVKVTDVRSGIFFKHLTKLKAVSFNTYVNH